jgi:hypothetical protein
VQGKGQQVEGDEDVGEGHLAAAEAVLEVVSAGLEDVRSRYRSSSAPGRRRPIRPRCPPRP